MRRRTVLKTSVVGGAALLGAGFWMLPGGARPAAVTLEVALAVLDGLHGKALRSLRGWSPDEVFNHCAQSIEYSMDGYPELKPLWFRHSIGPAALLLFSARGGMRHPLDEAIPGAPSLKQPAGEGEALQRLRLAFERFATYTGVLRPHFAYGQLDHARYTEAHVLHLYNHLSLIRPA